MTFTETPLEDTGAVDEALVDLADLTVVDGGRAADYLLDIMNGAASGSPLQLGAIAALGELGSRSLVPADELRGLLENLPRG
jgi:hypothetical protein